MTPPLPHPLSSRLHGVKCGHSLLVCLISHDFKGLRDGGVDWCTMLSNKAERDAVGLFTKAARHTIKVAAAALKSVASDVPSSLLIVDGISVFISEEPKACLDCVWSNRRL